MTRKKNVNHYRLTIFTLIFGLILSGCGSPIMQEKIYPSPYKKSYLTGFKKTVSVGVNMLTSKPFLAYETIQVDQELEAKTTHRGRNKTLTIGVETCNRFSRIKDGTFYRCNTPMVVNGKYQSGGIYISNTHDGDALFWLSRPRNGSSVAYMAPLNRKIEYEKLAETYENPDIISGFVRVLTYTGFSNNTLNFTYKEFNDGMARDAFTQNISLDYIPEEHYTIKDSKFIVHEADISKITFTVITQL